MNSYFAAGPFDNPWVVIVIVVISALANWLAKRREAKQADQQPEGDEPTTEPGKPPVEFDLEDALRRLMGEEKPAPVPPPILGTGHGSAPPEVDWEEEEPFRPARQKVPTLLPPIIAVPQTSFTNETVSKQQEEAARRFEEFSEQSRHPATVVRHGHGDRSHKGTRNSSQWRDPRSARQAFVASMVFGTPKGLES